MKFTLEINLGNAAMQTGSDVAEALREVAMYLDDAVPYDNLSVKFGRAIMDGNGNRVGEWEVK